LILGAILTVIAYFSDPCSAPYTVFITACIMVLTTSNLKTFPINCITFFIIGVFLAIAMPNIDRFGYDGVKNAEVKQNLHSIQLALERYAEHHTYYPSNIATLLADPSSGMKTLPRNPFSVEDKHHQPGILDNDPTVMQPLSEIDFPYMRLEGQFYYFPEQEVVEGKLVTIRYRLLAFGAVSQSWFARYVATKPGAKVILMLEGGEGFEEIRALERSMDSANKHIETDTDKNKLEQSPLASPE
jgi:type II secretory pathway pseudopilin PulG